MRAADLDIHELLHFVPEGGRITFAGERVILLDAVALGNEMQQFMNIEIGGAHETLREVMSK